MERTAPSEICVSHTPKTKARKRKVCYAEMDLGSSHEETVLSTGKD